MTRRRSFIADPISARRYILRTLTDYARQRDETTAAIRAAVIDAHAAGITYSAIAKALGLPESTTWDLAHTGPINTSEEATG